MVGPRRHPSGTDDTLHHARGHMKSTVLSDRYSSGTSAHIRVIRAFRRLNRDGPSACAVAAVHYSDAGTRGGTRAAARCPALLAPTLVMGR